MMSTSTKPHQTFSMMSSANSPDPDLPSAQRLLHAKGKRAMRLCRFYQHKRGRRTPYWPTRGRKEERARANRHMRHYARDWFRHEQDDPDYRRLHADELDVWYNWR